jgi:pantothenate kinase-related protein Tda10
MLQVDADLAAINEKLRAYEAAWDAFVDAWLVVKVASPQWVYAWRLQAEHAMLASGKPGMSDAQVLTPLLVSMIPSNIPLPAFAAGRLPCLQAHCLL